MNRIEVLSNGRPEADEWISQRKSLVLAYSGHLQEARKMEQHAVDLAIQGGHREAAALYDAGAAIWEALYGNAREAVERTNASLQLSNDRGVEYGAALALALTGDSSRSGTLMNDLQRRFPEDTSVRFSYLPALAGRLALNRKDPVKAIEVLQSAFPHELGMPRTALHANFGSLYPVYVRGEAYLALHKAQEAAAEFQKILHHRGIVISDPIGALAHLQVGRAFLLAGERAKAETAYQDFLELWKDADVDIPILKQANAEYKRLKYFSDPPRLDPHRGRKPGL